MTKNALRHYRDQLRSSHETIFRLLQDAADLRSARNFLITYIEENRILLARESRKLKPLEWEIQHRCLMAFRQILSPRSERLAGHSVLNILWRIAHERFDELPVLRAGFFEEMVHMFRGIRGQSNIYNAESYPPFVGKKGREAALLRSKELDRLANRVWEGIRRYPTGLDPEIVRIREENRRRILSAFDATESDWKDYRWHFRHIIRDRKTLGRLVHLTKQEARAIDLAVKSGIPFGITPYYASLMDQQAHRKRDHAIRAQVIPPMDYVQFMASHRDDPSHNLDFMLEQDTSPIDLITRRYPMIVIFKPYNTCSQICVYCQRNWEIKTCLSKEALAPKEKIDAAIHWIHAHPAIREVLVTGGDPLVMPDDTIDEILSRLADIAHVERIRIGSRIPVVLPMRLTDKLVEILARYHQPGKREVALVTHFEHVYEITPESMASIQKLKKGGLSVYNQTVFTVENSRRYELVALRRLLRLIGVDPYYTFNTKGKEETRAYRVPLARLLQEITEEARLCPGLIRTDEPVYNVPRLGKNYIRSTQDHALLSILPDGKRVYEFLPWEKNLSLVDTYIDADVAIADYLDELKKRGENPVDYQSIWYYY